MWKWCHDLFSSLLDLASFVKCGNYDLNEIGESIYNREQRYLKKEVPYLDEVRLQLVLVC